MREVGKRDMREELKTLGKLGESGSKFRPRVFPRQRVSIGQLGPLELQQLLTKMKCSIELLLDLFSSLQVRNTYIHESPINQLEGHIADQVIQTRYIQQK